MGPSLPPRFAKLPIHRVSLAISLACAAMCPFPSHATLVKVSSGTRLAKRYEVYRNDTVLRWSDARQHASNLNAQLVSIVDVSENTFISSLITDSSLWVDSNSPPGNFIGPYIGLSQIPGSSEPLGGWTWEDGTSLVFNWFFNQPDNYNEDNVASFYNCFNSALPNSTWGDLRDDWSIAVGPYAPGPNPFLSNSFVVQYSNAVPGPLPALGAIAGFQWSRRLRRRLRISRRVHPTPSADIPPGHERHVNE